MAAAEDTPAEETPAPAEEMLAPEPAAPDPVREELVAHLEGALGDGIVEIGDAFGTLTVRVRPDAWRRAAEVAKDQLACDYLSFVSGIDWEPAPREGDEAGGDTSSPVQPTEMTFGVAGSAGRFQVFAHVQSTARHWGITFKTDVDAADPVAESWVSVYPGPTGTSASAGRCTASASTATPACATSTFLPASRVTHCARTSRCWPGS